MAPVESKIVNTLPRRLLLRGCNRGQARQQQDWQSCDRTFRRHILQYHSGRDVTARQQAKAESPSKDSADPVLCQFRPRPRRPDSRRVAHRCPLPSSLFIRDSDAAGGLPAAPILASSGANSSPASHNEASQPAARGLVQRSLSVIERAPREKRRTPEDARLRSAHERIGGSPPVAVEDLSATQDKRPPCPRQATSQPDTR